MESSEPPSSPVVSKSRKQTTFRGRDFSVYDAVAGLVTTNEPPSIRKPEKSTRAVAQTRIPSDSAALRRLAPEDVLFRRKDAPTRYEGHDIYWANERELPDGGRAPIKPVLPDSDLLKAIHGYSCQFYDAVDGRIIPKTKRDKDSREATASANDGTLTGRLVNENSMDETALLALGILLEEAGRSALGETGDLAFVEGEEEDDEGESDDDDDDVVNDSPLGRSETEERGPSKPSRHEDEEAGMQTESERERTPKRRRKA